MLAASEVACEAALTAALWVPLATAGLTTLKAPSSADAAAVLATVLLDPFEWSSCTPRHVTDQ